MPKSEFSSELKDKDMLRQEIEQHVQDYLAKGGKITQYPPEHNKFGTRLMSKKQKRMSRSLSQDSLKLIHIMRQNGEIWNDIAKKHNMGSATIQRQYKDWLWELTSHLE